MSIYEFVRGCMEQGLSASEAEEQWIQRLEERQELYEIYADDPMVQEGWRQDDLIDMYRRER